MSIYQEGQKVQTPQGQGKVATDQVDEQVYVLLNDTGNMETFHQNEIKPETAPEIAELTSSDADAFNFDDFLSDENNKPKEDY